MKNPPHPGDFIRTEIIEPEGLSVTQAAERLGVARPSLSNLLNGKAELSTAMAYLIEREFGVSMDTLVRMQASYNVAQLRQLVERLQSAKPALKESKGRATSTSSDIPYSLLRLQGYDVRPVHATAAKASKKRVVTTRTSKGAHAKK